MRVSSASAAGTGLAGAGVGPFGAAVCGGDALGTDLADQLLDVDLDDAALGARALAGEDAQVNTILAGKLAGDWTGAQLRGGRRIAGGYCGSSGGDVANWRRVLSR